MIIAPAKQDTKLPRLLAAALDLFVKHGIDGTTTAMIARRARVAEGTIYRHFKSKEAMAWYIFSTHLAALVESMQRAVDSATAARDQLERAIGCVFDFYEADPVLFNFILLHRHQELRQMSADAPSTRKIVLKIIAQGRKTGELATPDAELATAMVQGVVIQIAEAKAYGRLTVDLRALTPQIARVAWQMLQPH